MAYVRKTNSDELYYDGEKGRLERINNVTWLTTTCSKCTACVKKRMSRFTFERTPRFYCGRDCLNESQRTGVAKVAKESTFMERYGVTNPYASQEVQSRRREACLQRYGVENVSQAPEVRKRKSELMKELCRTTDVVDHRNSTMIERYGKHWLATSRARAALERYARETYGVEHCMKSASYRDEWRRSFRTKHGVDNPLQIEDVKRKVRATCLRKYGVDNVFKRHDVVEKRAAKRLENCRRMSSTGEDGLCRLLESTFTNVERHVPIFYGRSAFWVLDFKVNDVFVQFDGAYWHGIDKDEMNLITAKESSDRTASMQLKAKRRDKRQNAWFVERNMKLLRIDETTAAKLNAADLRALVENCTGITSTY